MPAIESGEIKSIKMYIYRNSANSGTAHTYYVGCSNNQTDSASVLSTGITFNLSSGEGWKSADITDIREYVKDYTEDWYLLIGNPNTTGTYAEVAGYGSGKMLYLEVEFSNGSKIYLASNGALVPYKLYRAENGALVQYDIYHGENGSLIKY